MPLRNAWPPGPSSTSSASSAACATRCWTAPLWRTTSWSCSASSVTAGSTAPRATASAAAPALWEWTRESVSATRSARWTTSRRTSWGEGVGVGAPDPSVPAVARQCTMLREPSASPRPGTRPASSASRAARVWTPPPWLSMKTRSTAKIAMERTLGLAAMVSVREQELSAWDELHAHAQFMPPRDAAADWSSRGDVTSSASSAQLVLWSLFWLLHAALFYFTHVFGFYASFCCTSTVNMYPITNSASL